LIEEKWNLAPLTRRDDAAVSPLGALDLDAPPAFLTPPELPAPKAGGFRPALVRRAARRAETRRARLRKEDGPAGGGIRLGLAPRPPQPAPKQTNGVNGSPPTSAAPDAAMARARAGRAPADSSRW